MDIQAIQDNIEELENDDTTVDNVKELALLYIVREYFKKSQEPIGNDVITEYEDILPQYHKYIEVKKNYQKGNKTERAVEMAMRKVCKEIYEFIHMLYSCTDMPKERSYLKEMIENLQNML